MGMNEPLPRSATEPHEFPATAEGWYEYRRWLARHGREVKAELASGRPEHQLEAARREWDAIAGLTDAAERAYREFRRAELAAEFEDYSRQLAERIHADWVDPASPRPQRDPRRHLLASLDYAGEPGSGVDEGLSAGRPVELDARAAWLSAAARGTGSDEDDPVTLVPRGVVLALTDVLEEFAARLMKDRADGRLIGGERYIQAVVDLQADLESRRFDA
ncbi:MAG TPA: hypothetical protein VGL05_37555 [Kribbella sp.]